MGVACNEWRRVPVLCLTFIFFQTTLSEGAELFDLSELSVSQQDRLWTQVDNWAVAVVLTDFLRAAYFSRSANSQYRNPLCHSKQYQENSGTFPRNDEECRREYLGL